MTFTDSDRPCAVKYRNSDKIRILAKDLDFILSYLEKGEYQVDGVSVPFDYSGADLNNFNIEMEKEHLKYAQKIVSVLDLLGCHEDIDINDMETEDWRNLNRLIDAFVDHTPVSGLNENLPSVCYMKVGKLRFVLYLRKHDGIESGKYELLDFFRTEFQVAFDDRYGNKLPISQFCILHADDFLSASNIDFDIFLPSYQKAGHHYETFNRANWFLLELLSAYDKATGWRREKILETCEGFGDWISMANEDELDYQTKMLNVLQIVKRRREFTKEEMRILFEIVEAPDTREDCLVGAYLLLGQQQAAEMHFARLAEDEQKCFKSYPIYYFWEGDEN